MAVNDFDGAAALTAASGGEAKREYVRQVFSQIAPRYDLLNHLLSFNIDRGWRRRAIAALEWRRNPTGVYIDLCAGTLDVAVMLTSSLSTAAQPSASSVRFFEISVSALCR